MMCEYHFAVIIQEKNRNKKEGEGFSLFFVGFTEEDRPVTIVSG
jgi:hypothetical protein